MAQSEVLEALCREIEGALARRGESQRIASIGAGLPAQAIKSVLSGGHSPSLERAHKLCAYLGIELRLGSSLLRSEVAEMATADAADASAAARAAAMAGRAAARLVRAAMPACGDGSMFE